jgi:Xaa-Pro dipeptidase
MDQPEYVTRINKIRTEMEHEKIDVLMLLDRENTTYLTNLWGFSPIRLIILLVPLETDPYLIVPMVEAEYARTGTWVKDVVGFTDWHQEGPIAPGVNELQGFLKNKGLLNKVVGIEKNYISINLFNILNDALPGVEFKDCTEVLRRVRLIKSPWEIKMMRRAGEVAVAEFQALIDFAEEGVMEFELSLKAIEAGTYEAVKKFGEDYLHSPIIGGVQILASGPYVSMPHKMASTRRLQRGDKIQPCFCNIGFYKGYHSSFGRAISVGPPSRRDQELYDVCLKAQEEACRAIKPGIQASEIYRIMSDILREYGEGEELHRGGRGLGLGYVEPPDLSIADHTILQPGMVFSVEPSIYMPGSNGMRIEDTVLVTEKGCEKLTEYRKDFQII